MARQPLDSNANYGYGVRDEHMMFSMTLEQNAYAFITLLLKVDSNLLRLHSSIG